VRAPWHRAQLNCHAAFDDELDAIGCAGAQEKALEEQRLPLAHQVPLRCAWRS
jgi:hypothetical protein